MEQVFEVRRMIISMYKQYEIPINIGMKFLAGLFVFFKMGMLSMGSLSVNKVTILAVLFSALTAVGSPGGFFILALAAAGIYLFFASIETALAVVCILFLFLVFYVRLFPKQSLLIPALFIAYYFKVPYAVAIFAGAYVGIGAIVPVAIGVFLYAMIPAVYQFVSLAPKADFTPLGMPDAFIKIYVAACEYFMSHTQWMTDVVIFSVVVIIVCILAHMTFNFAKEISILSGGAALLFCYGIAILLQKTTVSFLGVFIGVIFSPLIVYIIRLFEDVPDYPRAEKVEFEDSENYYFVKVVPKCHIEPVYDLREKGEIDLFTEMQGLRKARKRRRTEVHKQKQQ